MPRRTTITNTEDSPSIPPLPDASLAQCLQRLRTERSWTRAQLAARCAMPITTINELEEGIQLSMPVPFRQRLAKALRVFPEQLQALEKFVPATPTIDENDDSPPPTAWHINLHDPNPNCPECTAPLRLKTFWREDMHGHPVETIQATCTQCLFRHRQERTNQQPAL